MLKRVILWDWNGTLLNDVQYAIDIRNKVFPRFGLPKIQDKAAYHEQFTFPVRVYYERAGVTRENFEAVANAWMDAYVAGCHAVPLFEDAILTLNRFSLAGFAQVVLSASQEDNLRLQLAHAGILDRFYDVLGLSHIYATDKTHLAKAYLANRRIDPADCVLLGDTVHDALVAGSLKTDCILIARGHMSKKRLLETQYPVCASLSEAAELVLGRKTKHI
ncbi:MAG: HAD hydrolase-like protein [Bacillota bacterium]